VIDGHPYRTGDLDLQRACHRRLLEALDAMTVGQPIKLRDHSCANEQLCARAEWIIRSVIDRERDARAAAVDRLESLWRLRIEREELRRDGYSILDDLGEATGAALREHPEIDLAPRDARMLLTLLLMAEEHAKALSDGIASDA
jgi:hypothetical protein